MCSRLRRRRRRDPDRLARLLAHAQKRCPKALLHVVGAVGVDLVVPGLQVAKVERPIERRQVETTFNRGVVGGRAGRVPLAGEKVVQRRRALPILLRDHIRMKQAGQPRLVGFGGTLGLGRLPLRFPALLEQGHLPVVGEVLGKPAPRDAADVVVVDRADEVRPAAADLGADRVAPLHLRDVLGHAVWIDERQRAGALLPQQEEHVFPHEFVVDGRAGPGHARQGGMGIVESLRGGQLGRPAPREIVAACHDVHPAVDPQPRHGRQVRGAAHRAIEIGHAARQRTDNFKRQGVLRQAVGGERRGVGAGRKL